MTLPPGMGAPQALAWLDRFPDPLLVLDAHGVIVQGSRAAAVFLQAAPSAGVAGDGAATPTADPAVPAGLAGQPLGRWCDDEAPDAVQALQGRLRAAARSSAPQPLRLRLRTAQGIQPVHAEAWRLDVPAADAATRPLLCLRLRSGAASAERFAALNDRVEALAREVRRRQAAESAERTQREWLRVVLRSIGDAVIATDAAGGVVFMNPVAEQLTGWPFQQACGLPVARVFQIINEFSREPVTSPVELVLRDGRIVGLANHTLLIARDGAELPIDDAAAPIVDDAGAMQGVVLVFREISQRVQAERERRALEQQLREAQKLEAVGTLAGGIAHDFNNVLGAVLGNTDLLQGELPPDHPAQQRLAHIAKAGRRGRELVRQIMAFSRRQPHTLRRIRLQPLVEETLALLRATLPSHVDLQAQLHPQPLQVLADATQISQVLMNLCTNAWQALQGRQGRVLVRAEPYQGPPPPGLVGGLPGWQDDVPYVRLSVADDGCGIDEPTLQRIFDPFFTTKPRGQGTGLGLPVVLGIVAEHRGTLAVHSQPGGGSRFEVLLPDSSHLPPGVDSAEAADTLRGGLPVERAAARSQGALAYVDDDEIVRITVQALLQRAGYQVAVFASGPDLLRALEPGPGPSLACELVITDYNMPQMNGLDLLRALRRGGWSLPVILSSGYLGEDLLREAQALGAARVLNKEETLERLPGLIEACLAERRAAGG